MTAPTTTTAAVRALEALLALLDEAGIVATRDPGAFYPQPVGVLVGNPTLEGRGQATRRFTVPVLVVSGDPFNSKLAIDRALALADEVALALRTDNYRPSNWPSPMRNDPLPAIELAVTVTVPEEEASP